MQIYNILLPADLTIDITSATGEVYNMLTSASAKRCRTAVPHTFLSNHEVWQRAEHLKLHPLLTATQPASHVPLSKPLEVAFYGQNHEKQLPSPCFCALSAALQVHTSAGAHMHTTQGPHSCLKAAGMMGLWYCWLTLMFGSTTALAGIPQLCKRKTCHQKCLQAWPLGFPGCRRPPLASSPNTCWPPCQWWGHR